MKNLHEISDIVGLDHPDSPKIYYTLHNVKKEVTLPSYPENNIRIIPEGMEYYKCSVPFSMINVLESKTGKYKRVAKQRVYRNEIDFLMNYGTNYILLNPGITKNIVKDELIFLRDYYIEKKVGDEMINDIIDLLYADIKELRPCDVIIKYRWINPDASNKKEIYLNSIRKDEKINEMISKLLNELPEYKITKRDLLGRLNITRKTLYKYMSEDQKCIIKSHNKKYNKR